MKRFFLTAVVAAIGLGAYPASGQAVDSTRSWSEGPLRWEEFRGDDSSYDNVRSVITWDEHSFKERRGYIRYSYPVVHSVFHPGISFVRDNYSTDEELRRQQYLFDLNEFYARAFRDSLLIGVADISETRRLFCHRCLDAFEKQTIEPAFLQKTLAEDPVDPKTLQWEKKTGSIVELGVTNKYILNLSSDYNSFASCVFFKAGTFINRFSAAFEVSLSATPRSVSKLSTFSYYNAQILSFGYTFYQKERFCLNASLGGGVMKYSLINYEPPDKVTTVDFERGVVQEAIQAEYTLASFVSFSDNDCSDIRLFARLGSDQLFLWNSTLPSVFFNFGLNFTINHLSITDGRKAANR